MIAGSKILVTGATGFFGRHLVSLLRKEKVLVQTVSNNTLMFGDYRENLSHTVVDIEDLAGFSYIVNKIRPDYIFHLAGYNGGIKFNQDYPFDIFRANTDMATSVINAAIENKVKKVVSIVTSCAYPENEIRGELWDTLGNCYSPREECYENDFFNGPIHHTVACHGYAKRNLQLASAYAAKQYGLNAVCVCPTTLYGPGDSFDPNRTKVMGGLISKFIKAKQGKIPYVECWGTGKAMREFIYVEDAAKLVVESLLKYDNPLLPLNIGSGQELSIRELAEIIAETVEYEGEIRWDHNKPDGQFRKRLDLTMQKQFLGTIDLVPLKEGIRKTVDWRLQENII